MCSVFFKVETGDSTLWPLQLWRRRQLHLHLVGVVFGCLAPVICLSGLTLGYHAAAASAYFGQGGLRAAAALLENASLYVSDSSSDSASLWCWQDVFWWDGGASVNAALSAVQLAMHKASGLSIGALHELLVTKRSTRPLPWWLSSLRFNTSLAEVCLRACSFFPG